VVLLASSGRRRDGGPLVLTQAVAGVMGLLPDTEDADETSLKMPTKRH